MSTSLLKKKLLFRLKIICRDDILLRVYVEHKGADRYSSDDSKEKRMVGDFWAQQSQGKCLFVMTCGENFEVIKELL